MLAKNEMGRRILKIFVGTLVFFSFFYVNVVITDPDLGWHVRVGQEIQRTGAAPRADTLTHTMPGYPWVDHEWLTDYLLGRAWGSNLWWLVVFVFSLLASVPFWFWIRRAPTLTHLWLTVLTALAVSSYLGIRPHVISFFFLFLVLEVLTRYFYGNESRLLRAGGVALPLLFFLWANLHGGFSSGLLLFALFLGIQCVQYFRGALRDTRRLRWGMALFFISLGATLINPYGLSLYKEVLGVLGSKETAAYILEWKSPLALGALLTPLLLGIFLALGALFYKQFSPYVFVPALVFCLAYLRSAKLGPAFFAVLLPFFHEAGTSVHSLLRTTWERRPPPLTIQKRLRVVGGMVFLSLFLLYGYALSTFRATNEYAPEDAVAFLRGEAERGVSLRLFNEYGWGGYLTLHAPELKVFIDGRMPHWVAEDGSSPMRDYVDVLMLSHEKEKQDRWKEIFKRRDITAVLIRQVKRPVLREEGWLDRALESAARSKVLNPILTRFVNREELREQEKSDLRTKLVTHGWRVSYEDAQAVILECEGMACY